MFASFVIKLIHLLCGLLRQRLAMTGEKCARETLTVIARKGKALTKQSRIIDAKLVKLDCFPPCHARGKQ